MSYTTRTAVTHGGEGTLRGGISGGISSQTRLRGCGSRTVIGNLSTDVEIHSYIAIGDD